jgi:hypothetical protein
MKRWIYITGFFATCLFLGILATRLTHQPVPDLLMYVFGFMAAAFAGLLLYKLLQKIREQKVF